MFLSKMSKSKKMKKIILLFLGLTFLSCDKFLDIQPKGKVIPETTEDFRRLLNSGYKEYPNYKGLTSLRSDEFILNENSDDAVTYHRAFSWEASASASQTVDYSYGDFYKSIFYANQTIIQGSQKMPNSAEKNQILAEAYALRAYNYFGLVTMYAKPYDSSSWGSDLAVPISLEVDLEKDYKKSTTKEVYEQIFRDLQMAESLMQIEFQQGEDNFKFSKVSLFALASRVYLHTENWDKSLEMSEKALSIKSTLLDLNVSAEIPSKYNSEESLLALEPTFVREMISATFISPEIISLYNPTDDLRFSLYFEDRSGNFRARKQGEKEFRCSFRTSELYLNKAEALSRKSSLSEAKQVFLEFLKMRYTPSGFSNLQNRINGFSAEELLQEIFSERAKEFIIEGHRWFDLRRFSQKEIFHTIDATTYRLIENDPRYTIPLPKEAVENNINL